MSWRRDPDKTARMQGCLIAFLLVLLAWGFFIRHLYYH
jgi:hypothetical protein